MCVGFTNIKSNTPVKIQILIVKLLEFVAITAEAIKVLSTIFLQHMGLSSHDIMVKSVANSFGNAAPLLGSLVAAVIVTSLSIYNESFNDFDKTP